MFIPTTKKEIRELDWDRLDVILVTGDSYIDSPLVGVAVIGKVLPNAGYRVGIIAQPAGWFIKGRNALEDKAKNLLENNEVKKSFLGG